jgi:hypothetical protein
VSPGRDVFCRHDLIRSVKLGIQEDQYTHLFNSIKQKEHLSPKFLQSEEKADISQRYCNQLEIKLTSKPKIQFH